MMDTVDALAAARAESLEKKTNFGLYACTVTAIFNISSIATTDRKIGIGLTGGLPATIAPISIDFSGSKEATTNTTTGNTVTLVLATPECMPSAKPAVAAAAGAGKGAAIQAGGPPPSPPPDQRVMKEQIPRRFLSPQ
jgi:hypothetical protein